MMVAFIPHAEKQADAHLEKVHEFCRVIMGSDKLSLPAHLWLNDVIKGELLPLTAKFAHNLASNKREARIHGPPLRFSLKLLSKTLLHYLPLLAEQPSFPEVWGDLLQLLQVPICPPTGVLKP
jgi:hypothetical protein